MSAGRTRPLSPKNVNGLKGTVVLSPMDDPHAALYTVGQVAEMLGADGRRFCGDSTRRGWCNRHARRAVSASAISRWEIQYACSESPSLPAMASASPEFSAS